MTQFPTIFRQKCLYLRPLLSITFPQGFRISKNIGHPTLGNEGEKTLKKDRKPKKTEKSEEKNFFLRGDFRQFSNKNVHIWDHFFPIFFPQGFRISKNIGHPTSGSGGKKTVKRYLKSEQTDRRMDKSTYRKHRPRGPMLWKLKM